MYFFTDEISEISPVIQMYKFDIPDPHSSFLAFLCFNSAQNIFKCSSQSNIIVELVYIT